MFTTAEENKAVVSLFCELGISSKDKICIETEVNLREKKGQQIFPKTVRASKLIRQRTIQINNAHLDSTRCWQFFQEATKKKKKTYSFTVSWQKQIKLYPQGVVILFLDVVF